MAREIIKNEDFGPGYYVARNKSIRDEMERKRVANTITEKMQVKPRDNRTTNLFAQFDKVV